MNDYKELIEKLRAGHKIFEDGHFLGIEEPTMGEEKAADAIEQLVKERDALRDANDSAHKDRREAESKAAKAELEVVCLKEKLADTVDTVKVVRCKDCKKWDAFEKYHGYCYRWHENTASDFFCAGGERKDE